MINLRIYLIFLINFIVFAYIDEFYPSHPMLKEFSFHINNCKENSKYCDDNYHDIALVAAKLSNEHAALLLLDRAQAIFMDAFYYIFPESILGNKLTHMIAILAFAQGDILTAEKYWSTLNRTDLSALRTYCSQLLMTSKEKEGLSMLSLYTDTLGERFHGFLENNDFLYLFVQNESLSNTTKTTFEEDNESLAPLFIRSPSSIESERTLLSMLLSEAQGGVRLHARLGDLILSTSEIRPFDAKQRFRLGVSLAKLGLYDLSQQHITLASTPWDPAHHRLRATMSFPQVHKSLRALAQSVNFFEQQAETVIMSKKSSSNYRILCESFEETSLVLDVLPLLHLAGYNSPRNDLRGTSPVPPIVLLGEFYRHMCPPYGYGYGSSSALDDEYDAKGEDEEPQEGDSHNLDNDSDSDRDSDDHENAMTSKQFVQLEGKNQEPPFSLGKEGLFLLPNRKLRVGVVSGSFDSMSGRLIVGILDDLNPALRSNLHLMAMCFPTPRDKTTDRVNALFHEHINLFPRNRTQTLMRIQKSQPDFVLFSDAGCDCRTFALAHMRLAPFQGALWGWGGTLGIPTIDYYFFPEILWSSSKCYSEYDVPQLPQELYSEQVILLSGVPPLAHSRRSHDSHIISRSDSWVSLQEKFLFPPQNRSHMYILPGTVRDIHPEMDVAIALLLKTDPIAMIVVASPISGRDMLPHLHPAVRHDLTHPAMPIGAIGILRRRLLSQMGSDALNRLRFLPPLDDDTFFSLRSFAVAILDPFPVGVHIPVLDALVAGIPVISAPALQECTNSYTVSISQSLGISGLDPEVFDWPYTPEEYAVLAMRLPRDVNLRSLFARNSFKSLGKSRHADELLKFISNVVGVNKS